MEKRFVNIQTHEDFTQALGVYSNFEEAVANLLLDASEQYDQSYRFDPIANAEGDTGMVFNVYDKDGKYVDSFFTLTVNQNK